MSPDPVNLPLKIRRGIAYGPLKIVCRDANHDPVPLTSYTVAAVARPETESTTNIDLEPTITNAAAGEITISLDVVDTGYFPVGEYVYDLILTTPGGVRLPPVIGGPLRVIDTETRL